MRLVIEAQSLDTAHAIGRVEHRAGGAFRVHASEEFLAAGAPVPGIAWQNRPTYQQAVEVQGHR